VVAVTAEPLVTPFGAPLWRLLVSYANPNGDMPTRLIFKCAQSGDRGAKEVEFYAGLARRLPHGVVPACLDAAISADGAWHLLLADLSETHRPPVFPLPPTESDCHRGIRALARVHAAWWNDNRLGRGIGTGWNDDRISELCNDTEQVVRSFLAFLGDALSPRRRSIYEQLLAVQTELRHRQMARPLTVTHGDAHWGNFLFPRDARIDTAALIDWELWEVAPAANDLAYHIALWSWPERRHRLELPLLRTYHSELQRWGVNDYAWETCVQDYRLFVAKLPLGVAWMWHRHLAPLVWWDNLERAVLAFDDLDCAQLLE
jgi:hypothetical protein